MSRKELYINVAFHVITHFIKFIKWNDNIGRKIYYQNRMNGEFIGRKIIEQYFCQGS